MSIISGKVKSSKIIYVRDLRDHSLSKYFSQWDASKALNVNASIISNYLKTNRTLPFRHFWSIWTDSCTEIVYSEKEIKAVRGCLPKTIVVEVLGEETQVYVFSAISDVADHYYLNAGTIRLWINDGLYHKTLRLWYIHDYKENKRLNKAFIKEKTKVNSLPSKPSIPVIVTDTTTGEVKQYKSTQEFANEKQVNKNTIQRSMGRKSGSWDHYHLKYL